MAEEVRDGQEKFINYKVQFQRLKKALDNEFYLEAIFIEYAILEDRTESVLRHGGLWAACRKKCGKKPGIEAKLNFIRGKAADPACPLHKYFSDDLLDRLKDWKNKRNPLIHALLKQKLETEELRNLAREGNELVRILRTRVANHNRVMDRLMAQKESGKIRPI